MAKPSASARKKKTSPRAATEALSWIRLPSPRAPTGAVRQLHESSRQRLGFVRNFLRLPFRAAHLVAIQTYLDLLVRGSEGLLSVRERELIALVVSVENRCEVCVLSHATALQRAGLGKDTIDILTVNWRRASLGPRERALAVFASRVTLAPVEADEFYIDGLRDAGLTEAEVLEAAQVASIFNFTNRLNSVLGVRLNPEAHAAYRAG